MFSFVIGSDLLPGLGKWYKGEELMEEVSFIIFNRVGSEIKEPEKIKFPKVYKKAFSETLFESSSTEVRRRFQSHNKENSFCVLGIIPQ